jgi:hypothetical protein
MFNFFDTSRFFLNQRYNFLNNLTNQTVVQSTTLDFSRNSSNDISRNVSAKLSLLQSYFGRDLLLNTSLYTSVRDSSVHNLTNQSNLLQSSTIQNIFLTTSFTDLLQQNDLHSLNTINASSNASNQLFLNKNYTTNLYYKV